MRAVLGSPSPLPVACLPPTPDVRHLRALLDRAARPDATAAEIAAARQHVDALFTAHQERIYWVCLKLVGNPERAAELAQETMLVGYRRLAEYEGEGSFYAWLYSIARFTCLRANAKKREALGDDGLFDPQDPARGVLAAMRRHERDELLRQACRAVLDPVEQEAVTMRYVMNMGVEEITAVLGLSSSSGARGLLQTCRRKLRRELQRRLDALGHGASLLFGSAGAE
jgi:RNA polymerase sigma-70 factor (ECF subfamily)